jgi:hypothetical protein
MKTSYKEGLIRGGILFVMFLIRVVLALFAMWLVAPSMIDAATRERGYSGAIGGEYIVIIGIGIVVYLLLTFATKRIRPP